MSENQTVVYTTGQTVQINYPENERLNGKRAVYKYAANDGVSCLLFLEDTNEDVWVQPRYFAPFVEPEPINRYTPPMSYEVLREAHAALERQASLLTRKVESLSRQVNDGHAAVQMIGERLIEEAEKRGWCSEFDEIIDEVNGDLPGSYEMPVREKEYEVRWTQTVTVNVDMSATFTARSADAAEDMARDYQDGVETSSILDAVRCGNYEEDWDGASDFEVCEV